MALGTGDAYIGIEYNVPMRRKSQLGGAYPAAPNDRCKQIDVPGPRRGGVGLDDDIAVVESITQGLGADAAVCLRSSARHD